MPNKLLKCRRLQRGDTIGLIGLASPINPELLESGKTFLDNLGFKFNIPLDPSRYYGDYTYLFSADSAESRLEAFTTLLKDEEIRAVLSTRGGYGSAELLPNMNFTLFRKNPKIFVGFSDITALLVALYQKSGVIVFHGPSLVTASRKYSSDSNVKDSVDKLLAILRGDGDNPFEGLSFEQVCGSAHEAKGRLIGGNLSILASMMGTSWQPVFDDHILFFEETGEEPYRIHRMLLQMKLAGAFTKLRGVLVGKCLKCESDDKRKPTLRDVLKNIFSDLNIPVLIDLPISHGETNYPIPLGVMAKIFQNKLELEEKSVI